MGRPEKSPQRHWLDGTTTQAKNGPAAFVGGRPKVPRHLSPIARRAFKRAVKLLEERGTLVESNETTLELYAETYARWIRVKTEAGESLMVDVSVTDNNGKVRVVRKLNPLLKLLAETESRLLALAKSLGLTQVDLGRCKRVADDTEKDGVVPGSIADLYPEMLLPQKDVLPFVPLAPEGAENEE
jgi:P27 family predicted phage terminase small subunit